MDTIVALVEAILANIEHTDLASLADQERADAVVYANAGALATHDLDATETALAAAARQLLDANKTEGDSDKRAESLQTAKDFATAIEAIRTERGRRAEVSEAAEAEAAEVLAQIAGETLAAGTDPETPVEPETPAPDGDPAPEPEPEVVLSAEVEPEPHTAPAVTRPRQIPLAAVARLQPSDVSSPPERPDALTIFPNAQLDIPGYTVGQAIPDIEKLADAFINRHRSLGRLTGGGLTSENVPIAVFDWQDKLQRLTDAEGAHNMSLVAAAMKAAKDAAEGGESLTAAGGFCAPVETIYGFVKVNTPTGLVQDFLPTLGAPRGKVQFPTSPDIRDAFTAQPSRAWTESNDIDAGNLDHPRKTVTRVACPTFVGCQLEAQYEILAFGNMGSRTYPEWVQHWIGLTADVHAHKVSEKLIGKMLGLSKAVVAVGPNGGATSTLFSNLALAAADMRSDLRMADDATVEVMLPIWTDDLIRSDLFRATKGQDWNQYAISDAQIASWFATLNIVPRYVTDWQTVSGNNATGATVWNSGLIFMIYPPGTFVRLDGGQLELGVVRDTVVNAANDFQIFSESFEGVCKPGIESRVYSMSLCATGSFSTAQNLGCNGIDIVGS